MKLATKIEPDNQKAYEIGLDLGTFLAENIYLLIALVIGLIAAIIMWKYVKNTPDAGTPPQR